MRIVKFLTEPRECADYLEARGLQVLTSNAKPARAPPEFCDGKLEDHRDFEDYVDPEPPDDLYAIDSPFYED